MDILFKRGGDSHRSFTPKMGEPVFTTDKHELFIGDDHTVGGVPVGTVKTSGSISTDMVALFKDTTGKVIKGISKASFLNGYLTSSQIDARIAQKAVAVKVSNATHSDTASRAYNSDGLGGVSAASYMQKGLISQTATENNTGKVASTAAIKKMYDGLIGLINGIKNTYIPNTKKSTSYTSTSTDTIATSSAVKSAYDRGSSGISVGNSAKSAAATAQSKADSAYNLANGNKSTIASVSSKANGADSRSRTNATRLTTLPHKITKGTGSAPTSGVNDGDIFLKYK